MNYVTLNTALLVLMFLYIYRTFRELGTLLSEAYTKFEKDIEAIKESLERLESGSNGQNSSTSDF
jgi:hypothetical protein